MEPLEEFACGLNAVDFASVCLASTASRCTMIMSVMELDNLNNPLPRGKNAVTRELRVYGKILLGIYDRDCSKNYENIRNFPQISLVS
jgi:hypothetical protein